MVGVLCAPDELLVRTARHVPGVLYQYRLEPDGRSSFPHATEGIEQIYEVRPEEVREDATVVFSRLHPDDLGAVVTGIRRSAATLTVWRQDYRVILPARGLRWLRGEASPQRLPGGAVIWHGYITDITDLKRAEAAHRESDALFRGLFEAMGQGVIIHGRDGEVIDVNPAAERILGLRGSQTCGRGRIEDALEVFTVDGDRLDPEDHPAAVAMRTGEPVLGRTIGVLLPEALDCRWLLVDAHPRFRPGEPTPHRIFCVFSDVSRERRAKVELEAAKDAALDASRAKSAFLATMSHEIRTPMNGVVGAAELLRAGGLSDTQSELVGTIESSAELLLSVIDDVLDFSRIESGRLEIDEAPFDLRAAVRATVEAMRPGGDVELTAEVAEDLPRFVAGDAFRLRQVLTNLVGNALKFTPSGRVEVRVAAAGDEIAFRVEDTGVGIPPERLASIFEPFVQADSSTARRYGGTGLGLSITKRLVELMGGRLDAESRLGAGSVFTACLPLAASAPPAPAPRLASVERAAGLRVLVAEDNAVNQTIVRRLLESLGASVGVVDGGRAAVEAALTGDWQLVLMDVQMPDMDGLEATREIRARAPRGVARLPIVALTANAMTSDREACLAVGMDDHLSKPVRRADIVALLRRLRG